MSEWPKTVDIYVHGSREAGYDKGEKLGLEGEALRLFSFVGYEHKMTYSVKETGECELVAVDGRRLES